MDSSLIKEILHYGLHALKDNFSWMGWNLFLAIIPLALSVLLFRRVPLGTSGLTFPPTSLQSRSRSGLWWLGVTVFVAFLPNAPYILTDIIHFISDVQSQSSLWINVFVFVPLYFLFILAGFEAYVLSLINLGYYLNQRGLGHLVGWIELGLHGLSAIGIYLGRFLRFNSWDIITRPATLVVSLDDLLSKRPLLAIVCTFFLVAGLYVLVKRITLAIVTYQLDRRATLVDEGVGR